MNIQEKIDLYVKGQLPEDQIDSLWVEIAKDPEILEQIELEATVREIILEKTGKKAKVNQLPSWTWHAAAAAAVLIVAMVQFLRVDNPTELGDFLDPNINSVMIEGTKVFRAMDDISAADSLMSLGAQAATDGNLANATDLFSQVLDVSSDSLYLAKANLNLGILSYSNEDYVSAEGHFRSSLALSPIDSMVREKAVWFLANTQVNLDNLEEARETVYQSYLIGGVFKEPSYRLLRKLDYDLGKSEVKSLGE